MKLPESIASMVAGYSWSEQTIGASSAKTFGLHHSDRPAMYLKIDNKQPRRTLLHEKEILEWLPGKLPVATVLCFDEDADSDYLLLSAIPGLNAADSAGSIGGEELVTLLAKGLRTVHEIPIGNCPFNRTLEREIKTAGYNVEHNLVDEDDFDDARKGMKAEDLYGELIRLRPSEEDLVFTHGDYCLPNIMIYRRGISGFIDLHRAGIADRYKDIALAVRSMRSNIGTGYEDAFFKEYGISEPDSEKIEYYMLLDEFF